MMKKWKKRLIVACTAVAAVAVIFTIYVQTYYRSNVSVSPGMNLMTGVTVQEGDGYVEVLPASGEAQTALIFYPGAKVEYTAYEPLMELIAEQGTACYLVHMPCNLAVLDMNAAEKIRQSHDYKNWYIGGHSLGGAMAAAYLDDHADEYDGLILLGAYSTKDLSDTDLKVLSVYGSQDQVLNREKYKEDKENLPDDTRELVIEGGNHAYYGDYGEQKGDGKAQITNDEQQQETADAITELIQN